MRQSSGEAFTYGLRFGIILTVIGVVELLLVQWIGDLASKLNPQGGTSAGIALLVLVGLAMLSYGLLFLAGILTSRLTGLVRSGALAASLALLISNVVTSILGIVLEPPSSRSSFALAVDSVTGNDYARAIMTNSLGCCLICGLLFNAFIVGGALGALGGLIGRFIYEHTDDPDDDEYGDEGYAVPPPGYPPMEYPPSGYPPAGDYGAPPPGYQPPPNYQPGSYAPPPGYQPPPYGYPPPLPPQYP